MQPKTSVTPPPNPTIGPAFSDLGLSDPILKALQDVGYAVLLRFPALQYSPACTSCAVVRG
jgi:hypothetical protein